MHKKLNGNQANLSTWLSHIKKIHPSQIELGLERVSEVARRLGIKKPLCPLITVGGTNGKGSTVAALEAIYKASGYRTGIFTSPIVFKHNEYVRINGIEVDDIAFCEAFERIERLRGNILLTPFEFTTLAALLILEKSELDVMILEVGLGGRLDAVNLLDADVAVVTSIGLDHTEWLGVTREEIAYEKAGIFRSGMPAVCGDVDPPASLIEQANAIGADLYCIGNDFSCHTPPSRLHQTNIAIAMKVVALLQARLPVLIETMTNAIRDVRLMGRLDVVPGKITHLFDVSHNPDSVKLLASYLSKHADGKVYAVFSMLSDKDIATSIHHIKKNITEWFVAVLNEKRAASELQLRNAFIKEKVNLVNYSKSIKEAYAAAKNKATQGDWIVVFGSFHTIAEVGQIVDELK